MALIIILIAVLLLALLVFGVVIFRKLPQLKVLDPGSSKDAKARELKQDILRQRLMRATSDQFLSVTTTMGAPLRAMQTLVRGIASKLTAIERSYTEREKSGKVRLEASEITNMLDEVRGLMNEGEYEAAEKKLIELVSLDPKNTNVYEVLGRLYILTKNLTNAKETFAFILKLAPKDASVHASMGEIAEIEGDKEEALKHFKKAKELSPNNPRYLDFFIEAAIANEEYDDAGEGVVKLAEVNPDNQKIALFEERIKDGKAMKEKK